MGQRLFGPQLPQAAAGDLMSRRGVSQFRLGFGAARLNMRAGAGEDAAQRQAGGAWRLARHGRPHAWRLRFEPRHPMAWRVSNTLGADFCGEALEEGLVRYGRPEIFNTDLV
jgi:hypothetical protein